MTDFDDVLPDSLFDRQGRPIKYAEYVRLKYETVDEDGVPYKRIALDQIGNIEVSTVWLGLNYNFMPGGAPIVFETMIFGGPKDANTWRYYTETSARMGHELVVAEVRRHRHGWIKHERDLRRREMKLELKEMAGV